MHAIMATKRTTDEPAFVLHRYDWSESSLILEVFTRHHGRMAVVAKGVKRPSSSFRPILLPLQLLNIAFGGNWGGARGIEENVLPQRMLVDYVRVYQSPEIAALVKGE